MACYCSLTSQWSDTIGCYIDFIVQARRVGKDPVIPKGKVFVGDTVETYSNMIGFWKSGDQAEVNNQLNVIIIYCSV